MIVYGVGSMDWIILIRLVNLGQNHPHSRIIEPIYSLAATYVSIALFIYAQVYIRYHPQAKIATFGI